MWISGTVLELMWRDNEMEQGQVCPYKVKLDDGNGVTWAPFDDEETVRKEGGAPAKKQKTGGPSGA